MPRPGGYWLTPPRTAATASSRRLCGPSVSGKPCPRLIAPVRAASALIVANTVGATVPAGSRRLAARATSRQRPGTPAAAAAWGAARAGPVPEVGVGAVSTPTSWPSAAQRAPAGATGRRFGPGVLLRVLLVCGRRVRPTSRALLPPPAAGRAARSGSREPRGSEPARHVAGTRRTGRPAGAEQPRVAGRRPRREQRARHGCRHHAPAPRERRALRASDPALEPQDEAFHLHRAQRHLHHRPAAVAVVHRLRLRLRQGDRGARRHDPLRRHEEAGPGARGRAGRPRGHALREPALAGRDAHELPDRPQAAPAA